MTDHQDADDQNTLPVEVDDDEMDDELGYAECDWSKLPQESVALHDRVLSMDYEALEALDIDALDDLVKWAAAQAFADFDDDDRFHDISLRIVRSTTPHPAIDTIEICMELVNDFMLFEMWDDLVFLLPDVERLMPDDETIRARLGAMISVGRGRTEEGMSVFQELADRHAAEPEVLLLLANDLLAIGQDKPGLEMLDAAQEVAELNDDVDVLQDILLFREALEAD